MKKNLLSTFAAFIGMLNLHAQNVTIPDANFKAYLVSNTMLNTNSDSEIQLSEAAAWTNQLNCSSLNISDLTGIEAFTAMTGLWCADNQLTTLDVSACTALTSLTCTTNQLASLTLNSGIKYLFCEENQLTSLDLSSYLALEQVLCGWNLLTSLDLSNHNLLYTFGCQNNLLTDLNVANGNNTNFTSFWAFGNPSLTCIEVDNAYWSEVNWFNVDAQTEYSLDCNSSFGCTVTIPDANFKANLVGNVLINTNADSEIQCSEATAFTGAINCDYVNIYDLTGIEAFTQLTILNCPNNYFTQVDLSANTELRGLYCQGNLLTSLDLSNNSELISLSCHVNQLSSLNLKNGNNANLVNLDCRLNASLTCIEVDDASYSTTTWVPSDYLFDATASFSENCSLGIEEFNTVAFSVYPNPVSTILSIDSDVKIESVRIFDLNGTLVQKETSNEFSVEHLENGMYIVTVTAEHGVASKRFVKN